MNSKFKIRVVSPWFQSMETEEAILSTKIPIKDADALLCDWAPSEELFEFPRRKAWYCCEPPCQFDGMNNGGWVRIRERLAPHEFFCHNHQNPKFRVPHITHFEDLTMNVQSERKSKAIAIVSNHGGRPWRAHPEIRYRNRFVTSPIVDLYGRSGWNQYQRHWYSRPACPPNYRGEIPGDWPAEGKRRLMSQYKVAICLENMNDPGYFSEKFVEAVSAGCIPVYRAHPSIAQTVLIGARWVDPIANGEDAESTIDTALSADWDAFAHENQNWLSSNLLMETHSNAVFSRIAKLLL